MNTVAKFTEANRQLAAAKTVDEVKEVIAVARGIKEYAKSAKDERKELAAQARELELRAIRRIGEMMEAQPRASVGQHKRFSENPLQPTLADAGIDKNLANRARTLHELPSDEFERMISEGTNPFAKPKSKSQGPQPDRHKLSSEQKEQLGSAVIDEGKTYEEAGKEAGVSNIVVRGAVAFEEGRRQGKTQADIDPASLSIPAQEKLQRAIKQAVRKLEADFERRVQDEIKQRIDEVVLPQYLKETGDARQIIESRRGIMTRRDYRRVLSWLHPDRVKDAESKQQITEIFSFFSTLELVLCDEQELPTAISAMPRSYAEMMRMREEVKARRRHQSNGVQQRS